MICLIRPPAVESFRISAASITLPLGLAYVAAAIESAGFELCVLDAVAEAPTEKTRYHTGYLVGLRAEELAARIPKETTAIGMTVIFTHEWPVAVHLMRLIRAARPELPIILGGEHITSMPEFCLASSDADYLVLGEGEETIVALLQALATEGPLDDIAGLAYRSDSEAIQVNPRRPRRRDVDDIAPPAWKYFDILTYNQHGFVEGLSVDGITMTLLATRGCPYQCTYCSSPNMWTPRWIARDAIQVVDEIEGYMKEYGARNFLFQDLTAIVQKDWIVTFCKEVLRRELDITWQLPHGTRSEAIDYEVAQLLKKTGMLTMSYAPESGSDRTRRLIKKKMKKENLFASLDAALQSDLYVMLFLIIGFPHDTEEDIAANLPFLREAAKHDVPDIVIGYYMALPGTPIFDSLYDAGKLRLDQDYFGHILQGLALWPALSHNEHMSRLELTRWKLKMYLTFYGSRGEGGAARAIVSKRAGALRDVVSDNHQSRMATAFRNGLQTIRDTVEVRFKKPWMSREDEDALFAPWDEQYRSIRAQLQAKDCAMASPEDTEELHKSNVVVELRKVHGAGRTIEVPTSGQSAAI